MLESSLWYLGVLQSARPVFFHPIGIFTFCGFPLRFTKPIQGLFFQGVQESGDLVLPDSYNLL